MKKYLLLVTIVLLILLSVTPASALEKQVNITAGAIVNVSGSLQLQSIYVNGTPFLCVNNICTALVSYDCPACPACPVCPTVNYTDLQANISSYISASQEKIIKSIIEHNSSPDFKREDIEKMLADDDEFGKIEAYFEKTVLVKDSDYKNMTNERDEWKGKWTNLNASYAIQGQELQAIKDDNERLSRYALASIVGFILFLLIIVLFIKLDLSGTISNAMSRFKQSREGLFPEERELQDVDRANRALEHKIKLRDKLAENTRLEQQLNSGGLSSPEIVAHEAEVMKLAAPIIDKKKDGVDIGIKPPPTLTEIKNIVSDYIKSKKGHSYVTKELYEHCNGNGITDDKAVSVAASEARNEIVNTEGGSWSWKWVNFEGERTTSHEYHEQQKEGVDKGGG